jgi:hypothetical protein
MSRRLRAWTACVHESSEKDFSSGFPDFRSSEFLKGWRTADIEIGRNKLYGCRCGFFVPQSDGHESWSSVCGI